MLGALVAPLAFVPIGVFIRLFVPPERVAAGGTLYRRAKYD